MPRFALDLSQPLPHRFGELFAPPVADVWLEIGFGGGEHLLWQAQANPSIGLIGCEPFQDGVVKVLSAIEEQRLANIRLHADDARPLLRRLPEASIGRASSCSPIPGRRRATTSAGSCPPRRSASWRASCVPGQSCASPPTTATTRAGFCWPLSDNRDFAWTAPARPTGASGPPIGRPPATSKRPSQAGRRCYYFRFRRG